MLVSSSYLLILAALPFGVLAALPSRLLRTLPFDIEGKTKPAEFVCSTTTVNSKHVFSIELHGSYILAQVDRLMRNLEACVPESAKMRVDWGAAKLELERKFPGVGRKEKIIVIMGEIRTKESAEPSTRMGEIRTEAADQKTRCLTAAVKSATKVDILCGEDTKNKNPIVYRKLRDQFTIKLNGESEKGSEKGPGSKKGPKNGFKNWFKKGS